MEEVKRNDLIFFRNDILKDIKNLEIKINERISLLTEQLQNSNLIFSQKFEYYQEKFDEVLKNVDTSEFQNKIKEKIEKYGKKIEETIINNNMKIQKIEKDLANSCYKYDKIFLKNMSSPGLIGDGCPYPTMKSFFMYLDKKLKELMKNSDKTFSDFNSLKIYLEKAIESFVVQIEKKEDLLDKNNEEKLKEYEKKINEKKKYLEDRFEHIRVENSKYIYNIIKNQEIINEKLKLEIKKYSLINEALIQYYNKQNKSLNNNKTVRNYNYLIKPNYTKDTEKKNVLSLNEVLPALKKIEENFNFNDILYKNEEKNDLDEFKKSQKSLSINNILKTNKSSFLRRSIGNFSFKSNKNYPNLSLYKEDNFKTLYPLKIASLNKKIESKSKIKSEEKQIKTGENNNSKLNIVDINNEKSEVKMLRKIPENNLVPLTIRKSIFKEEISVNNETEFKNELKIAINNGNEKDKIDKKEKHKGDKENKNDNKNNDIIKRNFLNANTINVINEENSDIKKKEESLSSNKDKNEKKVFIKEYKIKEKKKNDININYVRYYHTANSSINTISHSRKYESNNRNIDISIEQKINKIYKFIDKNNEEVNKKFDIIKRQLNYLLKEIIKIIKDGNKLKNNIIMKTNSNSNFDHNINFNNLYISGNSIIPMKAKLSSKSLKKSEKSNSFNNSEYKNIKKTKVRVINIVHNGIKTNNNNINNNINKENNDNKSSNNVDEDNEIDNYCFVLNQIEPYLIKKFQDH